MCFCKAEVKKSRPTLLLRFAPEMRSDPALPEPVMRNGDVHVARQRYAQQARRRLGRAVSRWKQPFPKLARRDNGDAVILFQV